MKVFFDTSCFIALFIKQEATHFQVVEKYESYKKKRAISLTSDYILDELYTRLTYDFGKHVVGKIIKTLKEAIEKEELRILRIDERIFQKSLVVMLKFADHKISFTDATTYVLCKDFAIDEIFTLDRDFKKMRLPVAFN